MVSTFCECDFERLHTGACTGTIRTWLAPGLAAGAHIPLGAVCLSYVEAFDFTFCYVNCGVAPLRQMRSDCPPPRLLAFLESEAGAAANEAAEAVATGKAEEEALLEQARPLLC